MTDLGLCEAGSTGMDRPGRGSAPVPHVAASRNAESVKH